MRFLSKQSNPVNSAEKNGVLTEQRYSSNYLSEIWPDSAKNRGER